MASVDLSDIVTRYLYTTRMKNGHFMPATDNAGISVAVITGLGEQEIWAIEPKENMRTKARADMPVEKIKNIKEAPLQITRDDNPFVGHANISGFPSDIIERRKVAKALKKIATRISRSDD